MSRHVEAAIQSRLLALQDAKNKEFVCKLIPTIHPETVIGARTPALRMLARELSKEPESMEFLSILPHQYFEENSLHGFLIETMSDYDRAITSMETFLPYIDNWATCDSISPKIFRKHLPELYEKIKGWLKSEHVYTCRFGIGMLMQFYLDEEFKPEMPELVTAVRSEEYYVNMMIAWYFATALVKQYDAALPVIQEQRLDKWTHNKAIQKAVESRRIHSDLKTCLKMLKVK